jgi:pseudaminic acid cytidylyltransferase
MNIAVIPARGGSKRIPRKNILAFAGKPIIAYSIEAAQRSGLFDHIIVSTDDEEIAAVSREWGAETPFLRPSTLSDDHTGTSAVVKHAIEWFVERNEPVAFACCIYATAPFLQEQYLREAFDTLSTTDKAYVFPVTSFAFPIQRAIKLDASGRPQFFYPEHITSRSQDLEPSYHDAGQFCFGRADAFLREGPIFGEQSSAIVIPRYLVEDIDTIEDWTRAELMFKAMSLGAAR